MRVRTVEVSLVGDKRALSYKEAAMGRRYRDERQRSDNAMHKLLWHRRARLPGSIAEARWGYQEVEQESICTVSVHAHWINHTPHQRRVRIHRHIKPDVYFMQTALSP